MSIYTSAQYIFAPGTTTNSSIHVLIDGVAAYVPVDPENRDYVQIMQSVAASALTIQAAS